MTYRHREGAGEDVRISARRIQGSFMSSLRQWCSWRRWKTGLAPFKGGYDYLEAEKHSYAWASRELDP